MPNLLTGRVIRLRQILVVLTLSLALLGAPALAQSSGRLVAVGDVHGDYDALVAILQQAGLIDEHLHWIGRGATLVQTGDFLDRGAKCRDVLDLLMALEVEAPLKGGRVVTLLGNHEAMNIIGDLRYAEAMYPNFADKNSEKRRRAGYDAFFAWQRERSFAGRRPATENVSFADAEATWMKAHPQGYLEQREAMSPSGTYGRWLRERPAVVKIGSTLFVHGGISTDLAGWKPDAIVEHVRSEVKLFDDLKQRFVQQKILLPNFTLEEATAAVRAELEFRKAELAHKMAKQNSNPSNPPQTFEAEEKLIQYLTMFLGYNNWFIVHPSGPLWFRGYANWSETEGAAHLDKLLADLGVSQIVVGHTPQQDGRIASRFGGRVFLIDTGMLSSYYSGGRASALEIAAGKYTAIYPDQRIVLRDAALAGQSGIAAPASRDDQTPGEIPGGGPYEQEQNPPAKEAAPAAASPAAPAPIVWYDPDGKPLPFKNDEEVLDFLRTAKVIKMQGTAKGITHPREAILEKDGRQMHASWRVFTEEKQVAQLATGERELNFRDDFIFEAAAYEMARILGMDNVPPTILRSINGEKGTLQAWVENAMDEGKRQKEKIAPQNARRWNYQIQIMRFFDNLVYNTDRNQGNIIIDKDWKVWLIDHSRAFRQRDNLNNPDALVEIDKGIWEKLLAMDEKETKTRLKPYLRGFEIDSLLKRRKKIIEVYRAEIAKRGESEVVRDMQLK